MNGRDNTAANAANAAAGAAAPLLRPRVITANKIRIHGPTCTNRASASFPDRQPEARS